MDQEKAIELAVDHLAEHGLSDITDSAFEQELIKSFRAEVVSHAKSKLRLGRTAQEMGFLPLQRLLTPKNRYVFDYRRAAIISPTCLVKYLALCLQAASCIEPKRVPKADRIVFSYRYAAAAGARIFEDEIGYAQWRERTRQIMEETGCRFLVRCDIASFYDRINLHRLQSTLEYVGVPKTVSDKINAVLMFWSSRNSYGLPVGSSASRILAEAALIDIDDYLVNEGVHYTRYVDDYRLFAPDIVTAQQWMNKLNIRLQDNGLMLNTGKTSIRRITEPTAEDSRKPEIDDSAEAVLKIVTRLTGGYSRIVRKFIMPASDKYAPFNAVDIPTELRQLAGPDIVEFSGIQKLVISCLVQQRFDFLVTLADECGRYLYALDYFVDMLLHNADTIPQQYRDKIADHYANLVEKHTFNSLDWHEATVARLFSHRSYFRKTALITIFRSRTPESGAYPSIIAINGLQEHLTRTDFMTIKECFFTRDAWEQRRLLRASRCLPLEERKAWLKTVKVVIQNDPLGSSLADQMMHTS